MKKNEMFDLEFLYLLFIILCVVFFYIRFAFASEVRTIRFTSNKVAKVYVSPEGTTLSFLARPRDVTFGRQGAFAIKYVESDIALSSLSRSSKSHMSVYADGKRYSFDLVAVGAGGDHVVLIRDDNSTLIEPKFK